MGVVHGEAVLVDDIGVDGVVGDTTTCRVILDCECRLVVDGVLGEQEVSAW